MLKELHYLIIPVAGLGQRMKEENKKGRVNVGSAFPYRVFMIASL